MRPGFALPPATHSGCRTILAALLLASPLAEGHAAEAAQAAPLPLVAGLALIAAVATALVCVRLRTRRKAASVHEPDDEPDVARMRTLLGLACDWSWQTDEAHRYIQLSGGFQHRSGLARERALGQAPWDLDWNAPSEQDWDDYRAAVRERRPVHLLVAQRDAAGVKRHLELTGMPLRERGRFTGYQGVGRDVTARITAERALKDSRARYRELVDSVSEVIFRIDGKGRLIFVNAAWERLTGVSRRDARGVRLVEYLHPDDRIAAWHEMSRIIRGEAATYAAQLRLHRPDGETRWIEIGMHPVSHDSRAGEHGGVAGTLIDISARKVAEMTLRNINRELEARVHSRTAELEASNRELEAFSYSVSHDLRAPLRSIDGFARILEEELGERLDDTAREHLERIRSATGRMARLIDDLIELAQLTRRPLKRESVDLSVLATRIMDELRAEAPARRVAVEITADLVVNADRTLIEVALENLLRNAWKFTAGRNPAQITFSAKREGDSRVFCVADNGVGFDMAFAGNLFRPFHRLHGASEFAGFGIGLANVSRIIQRHGGRIWADARPDEGARFHFTVGP